MQKSITLVFVHGYSVTNLNTYGELPIRLREEIKKEGITIEVKEIVLGKYVSFNDRVTLKDISKAFNNAINIQLSDLLRSNQRFICITHSTGGPVVRQWYHHFFYSKNLSCPMSHLIMLAPANFGSALAQLGKGKLSRLKSWFDGVEPGQGVLDWLELGSKSAWELNKEWIISDGKQINDSGIFPFVITGQTIDRKLYDNLNSYTGELGSDGVVRVAATNLNAQYLKLSQPLPEKNNKGNWLLNEFVIDNYFSAPKTAMRIVKNKSHSGDEMGILKAVTKNLNDNKSNEVINVILDCIKISNKEDYTLTVDRFDLETKIVQEEEKIEVDKSILAFKRTFIHDRYSQVIFKVIDTENEPIVDYDLILTAGSENNPNHLPQGFFVDRQKNKVNSDTLTYYFNYDAMLGASAIKNSKGELLRAELPGTDMLGFEIIPRPNEGFVRYLPCKIKANKDLLKKVIQPNSTTLIEIVMQRLVSTNVFELIKVERMPTKREGEFGKTTATTEVVR